MLGTAIITIGQKQWHVYVATTYEEITQGLGGLSSIPPQTGMLFDLGYDQVITVTTVPMLFPLDIVFIRSDMRVVDLAKNVPPGAIVGSDSIARYFLEVNAGETSGVQIGDEVHIQVLVYPAEIGIPTPIPPPPSMDDIVNFGVTATAMLFAGSIARTAIETVLAPPEPKKELPIAKRKLLPLGKLPLLPRTKEKLRPTRDDVAVRTWSERDRLGIWIVDNRTDETIAEWWDEVAREMFEAGFFKPGVPQHSWEEPSREFVDSVLDYAEDMGWLAKDNPFKFLPRTAAGRGKIRARSITLRRLEGDRQRDDFSSHTLTPLDDKSVWERANSLLRKWSETAPRRGKGYHKVSFIVTYEDGETYQGRFDLKHYTVEYPDLAKHIYRSVAFYAGRYRPPHMTEEQYKEFLEDRLVVEIRTDYENFLDNYEIGNGSPKGNLSADMPHHVLERNLQLKHPKWDIQLFGSEGERVTAEAQPKDAKYREGIITKKGERFYEVAKAIDIAIESIEKERLSPAIGNGSPKGNPREVSPRLIGRIRRPETPERLEFFADSRDHIKDSIKSNGLHPQLEAVFLESIARAKGEKIAKKIMGD